MNCQESRGDLTALAVGDVDPRAVPDLLDHVAACADCARELAEMRDVAGLVARELRAWVESGVAPPDLGVSLRQAVHRASRRPVDLEEVLALASPPGARPVFGRRSGWQVPLGLSAAAAAVLVLLLVSTPAARPASGLPVVGSLVQLLRPEAGAPVRVERSAAAGGVRLTVHAVAYGPDGTVVTYSLTGAGQAGTERAGELAVLRAGDRALALRRAEVRRGAGGAVRVVATYEPAPRGAGLVLRLEAEGGTVEVALPPEPPPRR